MTTRHEHDRPEHDQHGTTQARHGYGHTRPEHDQTRHGYGQSTTEHGTMQQAAKTRNSLCVSAGNTTRCGVYPLETQAVVVVYPLESPGPMGGAGRPSLPQHGATVSALTVTVCNTMQRFVDSRSGTRLASYPGERLRPATRRDRGTQPRKGIRQ